LASAWQWDDLRVFLAVAREGSFSAAARTLGVDHVTISRRVAALEHQLGTKLLHRTPEGAALTPAGQAIVPQCEQMETSAAAAERMIAGQDTRAAGSVRITSTEVIAYEILTGCVASLRRHHPQLQIDLITGVRTLDVSRREADIAVRVAAARPAQHGVVCRRIGEIGVTLYASEEYLGRTGPPIRGKGLAGPDLIRFPNPPRNLAQPFFLGEAVEGAHTALRSNDQFVHLKAAAAGVGIAEMACYFADGFPAVRRVWPCEQPLLKPVWLLYHAEMRRAARVRVVAAAIVEFFEKQAKVLRFGRQNRARPLNSEAAER
jgi:DNA-binding transcriptional LysR family regulator